MSGQHALPYSGNAALIDGYRMNDDPEARHRETPESWLPRDFYRVLDEIDDTLRQASRGADT